MQLVIDRSGLVHCIYGEQIDLGMLGPLAIRRASHVEPDGEGWWWADLAPVRGPALGPFQRRTQALEAEATWLNTHLLGLIRTPSPSYKSTKGSNHGTSPKPTCEEVAYDEA